MSSIAVFPKRRTRTRTNPVRHLPRKPSARLFIEITIEPPSIVRDGLPKRGLDVDQGKMIERVPNDHASKLTRRDVASEELVLGPQARAVHLQQRSIEIEECSDSSVHVTSQ